MPLYEYKCSRCGCEKNLVRSIKDAPPRALPAPCKQQSRRGGSGGSGGRGGRCGGRFERIYGTPVFRFVGPGFYVNDYGAGKKEKS